MLSIKRRGSEEASRPKQGAEEQAVAEASSSGFGPFLNLAILTESKVGRPS
jgi:hypothetical protein